MYEEVHSASNQSVLKGWVVCADEYYRASEFYPLGTFDQPLAAGETFPASAIVVCRAVDGSYERAVYTDASGMFLFDDAPTGKSLEVTAAHAQNKKEGERTVFYGRSLPHQTGPIGSRGGWIHALLGFSEGDTLDMGSIFMHPIKNP